MKKSKLGILLSRLEGFEDMEEADPDLEQHSTPPNIAADMLNLASVSEDIKGKKVVDLGSGTGILSLASALSEAKETIGVEKDEKAIEKARENKKKLEEKLGENLNVKFVQSKVKDYKGEADTVVMNPPFGIKKKDENLVFLEKAIEIGETVYTLLHSPEDEKEKTRKFIKDYISSFSRDGEILKRFDLVIPNTYKFHEKNIERIEADLWVIK